MYGSYDPQDKNDKRGTKIKIKEKFDTKWIQNCQMTDFGERLDKWQILVKC